MPEPSSSSSFARRQNTVLVGYKSGKPVVFADPCATEIEVGVRRIGILVGYKSGKPVVFVGRCVGGLQVGKPVPGWLVGYKSGKPVFHVDCCPGQQSLSRSPSLSVSQSISASVSESISKSLSRSASPSRSKSLSESPSLSDSASRSESPSTSESPSPSPSESPSTSPSPSPSESESPSQSPSLSPSISQSQSRSLSSSRSASRSRSRSKSRSSSRSVSPSPRLQCPPGTSLYQNCEIVPNYTDFHSVGNWISTQFEAPTGSLSQCRVYLFVEEGYTITGLPWKLGSSANSDSISSGTATSIDTFLLGSSGGFNLYEVVFPITGELRGGFPWLTLLKPTVTGPTAEAFVDWVDSAADCPGLTDRSAGGLIQGGQYFELCYGPISSSSSGDPCAGWYCCQETNEIVFFRNCAEKNAYVCGSRSSSSRRSGHSCADAIIVGATFAAEFIPNSSVWYQFTIPPGWVGNSIRFSQDITGGPATDQEFDIWHWNHQGPCPGVHHYNFQAFQIIGPGRNCQSFNPVAVGDIIYFNLYAGPVGGATYDVIITPGACAQG